MKESLKRIYKTVFPYRKWIIESFLCSFLSVVVALLIPVFSGDAIDAMVGKGEVQFSLVYEEFFLLLLVVAVGFSAQYVLQRVNQKITFAIARNLRDSMIEKIQKLPLSYLDSHPYGDIVNRMISDVDLFSDGLLMGLTQLFSGLLTILGTLIIMFVLNDRIAVVVALLTPLSVLVSRYIAKNINQYFLSQTEVRSRQTAYVNEQINQEKVVLAYHHEKESIADFDVLNEELKNVSMKATFFSSLINPSTRFISNVVYAIVSFISVNSALKGIITVGQVSIFLSYASQYGKPFNEISNVLTELQNALVCANHVLDLLEEAEEKADEEDALKIRAEGDVRLRDVSFGYVEDRILFDHLSMHVNKGEHIAIVGPTGSGKTTLINLLMRFYEVNDGDIQVDGCSIYDISRKSLRSNYGMVLQETFLKSGTIRENVAYGKEDASMEEIIDACKKVKAHSFIMRLPNGYDTVIQGNGTGLSQGEKQLLCIARVMLNLPNILILDEATSSIDTRTELKIQNAFNEMMEGRTTFIVAHRLSTIKEADSILVMKNGHIVEMGNHESLLKKRGFYYLLYNSQFES